jgi:response regulator RpfG family c-di-GMP phosphodiesterase
MDVLGLDLSKERIDQQKQNVRAIDFRLLDNYNWFFIALLWSVLIFQWKLISYIHAITFIILLAIYSCAHFYNSVMRGEIKNNEIVTMAIINVFACIPLLYYVPGFEKETWILLIWASIAVSTFNEMRNIILVLTLLCCILLFMNFFEGNLTESYQVAVLLMKIGMIFFVGLSFAKMQQEHYRKEDVLTDLNNDLEEKITTRTKRIEEVTSIAIVSLAKLTECRDLETGAHLERIEAYTRILINEIREDKKFKSYPTDYKSYITDKYIKELVQSSILHDIGKVGIPDEILLKPGRLTPEERKIMETHSIIGGDALKKAHEQIGGESFLVLAENIAYYHHEKYNGTGYPKGLKGEEIPLSARIACIADVYDSLRSKRPYKEPLSHEKAMEIMSVEMKGSFDPVIFKAFERVSDKFSEISEKLS